jgi:hypothetical protein
MVVSSTFGFNNALAATQALKESASHTENRAEGNNGLRSGEGHLKPEGRK